MNKQEVYLLLKKGNLLIVLRFLSTMLAFSLIITAFTLDKRTYIAWGILLLTPALCMLMSGIRKTLAGRNKNRHISNHYYFQHKLMRMLEKYDHKSKVGLVLIGLLGFDEAKEIKIETILAALHYKNKRTFHYSEGKFAVIIQAEDRSQVIAKAEKLRRKLTGILEQAMEEKWKTYVAVGVSLFPDHAGCWQNLLQTAEDALARAVAIRGGRVQLYYPILDRFSRGMNKKTKRQLEIITKTIGDKDKLIYSHSERVFAYTQLNCRELGLSVGKALPIECAAILHDLGKVSVRENADGEQLLFQAVAGFAGEHPSLSANMLRPLKRMYNIIPSVLHHHERFDGSGYPSGLKGSEIPLGARIIAVADFFDHVTTESAYNGYKAIREGINMLQQYRGSFFDPSIVDAFVKHVGKYKDLSQIIEWPKDISKIVPTGYKPGCFQLGGHYADFYSGEIHFMVKAVGCIIGGLINQEKCLYLTDEKKEKHILRNLYKYINSLTEGDVINSFGRLEKITFPATIITMDKRSAKFALEIKKLFKIWLDHAQKENCDSLRLIIDHSSLNIRGMELYAWEKAITRCVKNLDVIILCYYDINSVKFQEDMHALAQLHDSLFPEPC